MAYPPFTPLCPPTLAFPVGPNGANPTTGINSDDTPPGLFKSAPLSNAFEIAGDYIISGIGTRNTGQGRIKMLIPKDAEVIKAFLIVNTYVSNDVNDAGSTPPALPFSFQKESEAPVVLPDANCSYYCGSTCWSNPGPELATYLRNRVYVYDVGAIVDGSGMYTIGGLPVDLAMPIGTDGDRVPGCASSQGALLYVEWQYQAGKLPKNYEESGKPRYLQTYVGARLIAANTMVWDGTTSQLLEFDANLPPVYAGDARITFAAGDAQTSVTGDKINVNSTSFTPANNAFRKIGPSFSVVSQKISNIYANTNKAFVETTNDCVAWILFAISANKTIPKANFNPVTCVSTTLAEEILIAQADMVVTSNTSIVPFPAGCPNVNGNVFPECPFYVRIDREIILVVSRDPANDKNWNQIVRAQGGTTAAVHNTDACVKQVMPVEGKSKQQAALAKKGQPQMRPAPGKFFKINKQGLR